MAQNQQVRGVSTTVRTNPEGQTEVIYHETSVVSFDQNEIVLNSGGWRTNTTKLRMNQASNQFGLGYQVYQKNYEWFVDFKGETIEFHSGMILDREE